MFMKIVPMAATLNRQFNNVYVLSKFHYKKYKTFIHKVINLSCVLSERKLHMVYGGHDRGLSKLVSEVVFIKGSQVLSIIPDALKPLRCLLDPPTEKKISCFKYTRENI